jgi:hypothetical protein
MNEHRVDEEQKGGRACGDVKAVSAGLWLLESAEDCELCLLAA